MKKLTINKKNMSDDWRFKVMKMQIKDEATLFDILANQDKYQNLQDVEFSEDFINSIQFKLKIEGTTLDNVPINGHITTDLLNVCNALQNAINSIYASVVKGKNDARGKVLTDEEKENLTLVFKINQGSTEEVVENMPQIINSFNGMPIITQLTLIGAFSIIAGGYIYYLWNKNNNDKEKFLAQNTTVDSAIKTLEKTTLEALNSKKLEIEKATIGRELITRSQIQEICESINNDENDIEEPISAKFVVRKLYHKGNKKMATLTNKDYPAIESGFAKDLFENNETLFVNSFARGVEIDCEIFIEKTSNGTVRKATLLKINTQLASKPNQNS